MRADLRGRGSERGEPTEREGTESADGIGGGGERRLRGPQGGRVHSWGIRIGVEPLQQVTRILSELGSGKFEDVLAKYSDHNGLNARGEPKRSTVRAILQTLTHLGMVSVRGQTYQLSSSGAAYAEAIDTSTEAANLAAILQDYPAFVQLWDRIQGRDNVRHSEITQLFAHEFHYATRPAANFAAFFIGFASKAGLLRRKAGTHAYDTTPSAGAISLRRPRRAEQKAPDLPSAGDETAKPLVPQVRRRGTVDLREVARELGLALADPSQLLGGEHVERLSRALGELRESTQGPGLPRILKVAVDMATHAIGRGDERALRWSVQCFNGLVEMAGPPQ